MGTVSEKTLAVIRGMQQTEINEWATYLAAAALIKDEGNRETLKKLAAEEHKHYEIWKSYTGVELKPNKALVFVRKILIVLLGFTFTVKLMENREDAASKDYLAMAEEVPESRQISEEEDAHEKALLAMLDEERLQYVGAMVLGLNDALVELTGTLAGLTLALQNTRLIALSGLITGISATFSMASSEFLSARSEGRTDAMKSCVYTGIAYLVTVALLVLPYLIFDSAHFVYALVMMLVIVVAIIAAFNYYLSVAKDLDFKKRFLEMAGISLGVALLAFLVGILVKQWLGVDV